MRTIHLVRHGDHDEVGRVLSGRSAIPLNAQGRAQAVALGEWFDGCRPASLHSSPQLRARQTAAPIATRLDLSVREAAALDEIDFGTFTGRSFAALDSDKDWQRWNRERATARCPGGETMAEAVARAREYLWSLPGGDTAICVTHCDIIRGLVADLLGIGLDRMFVLDCDPGSVTTLVLGEGHARLAALNVPAVRPAPA
ncbi:histidine phosphatase family protein [Sphingomonas turrisvirgatae]|nr:histidine phosphatase family protein [Sphingomonas turrisvirgatae]